MAKSRAAAFGIGDSSFSRHSSYVIRHFGLHSPPTVVLRLPKKFRALGLGKFQTAGESALPYRPCLAPLRGAGRSDPRSGGIAALNPRLLSANPLGWPTEQPNGLPDSTGRSDPRSGGIAALNPRLLSANPLGWPTEQPNGLPDSTGRSDPRSGGIAALNPRLLSANPSGWPTGQPNGLPDSSRRSQPRGDLRYAFAK